jgi:hypothetical protein
MIKRLVERYKNCARTQKQIIKKPPIDKTPIVSLRFVLDQSFLSNTSIMLEAKPRGGTINEKMEPAKDSAQPRPRSALTPPNKVSIPKIIPEMPRIPIKVYAILCGIGFLEIVKKDDR